MPWAEIINLVGTLVPLGIQVATSFKRNSDGTTSVTLTLTQADAQFDTDIKQASDWLSQHPKV